MMAAGGGRGLGGCRYSEFWSGDSLARGRRDRPSLSGMGMQGTQQTDRGASAQHTWGGRMVRRGVGSRGRELDRSQVCQSWLVWPKIMSPR